MITLRSGRVREGRIVSQTRKTITLRTNRGTYKIRKENIRAIQYRPYVIRAPGRKPGPKTVKRKPRVDNTKVEKNRKKAPDANRKIVPRKIIRPSIKKAVAPAVEKADYDFSARAFGLLANYASALEPRWKDRRFLEGALAGNSMVGSHWSDREMSGYLLEGQWLREAWFMRLGFRWAGGEPKFTTTHLFGSGAAGYDEETRVELARGTLELTGGRRVFSHKKFGNLHLLLGFESFRLSGGRFSEYRVIDGAVTTTSVGIMSEIRGLAKGPALGFLFKIPWSRKLELSLEYRWYNLKGSWRFREENIALAESSGTSTPSYLHFSEEGGYGIRGGQWRLGGTLIIGKNLYVRTDLILRTGKARDSDLLVSRAAVGSASNTLSFDETTRAFAGSTRTDRLWGILVGLEMRLKLSGP